MGKSIAAGHWWLARPSLPSREIDLLRDYHHSPQGLSREHSYVVAGFRENGFSVCSGLRWMHSAASVLQQRKHLFSFRVRVAIGLLVIAFDCGEANLDAFQALLISRYVRRAATLRDELDRRQQLRFDWALLLGTEWLSLERGLFVGQLERESLEKRNPFALLCLFESGVGLAEGLISLLLHRCNNSIINSDQLYNSIRQEEPFPLKKQMPSLPYNQALAQKNIINEGSSNYHVNVIIALMSILQKSPFEREQLIFCFRYNLKASTLSFHFLQFSHGLKDRVHRLHRILAGLLPTLKLRLHWGLLERRKGVES